MQFSDVAPAVNKAVDKAKRLVFHCVGDTGALAAPKPRKRWQRQWRVR
jgi:hypothetical protein